MKVTKQNSINECGVCVINSFVNHYYKWSNKEKILNEANLDGNGLSIYDFENLGQKFGLYIESYECEWAEFCSLKNNCYYGLLIRKNELMHYVIIFKTKTHIVMFDSDSGKYELKYNELKKDFSNIVFQISKSKTNIKYTKQKIDLQSIDFKFLIICMFLHLAIIGLSTLFANVFNWTLNFSIYSKSTSNLISLVFIFCLITLLNCLLNYVLKHYSLIRFNQNFKYLVFKFINSIKCKNNTFINKIEPSYVYLIDSSIVSICNFLTVEISMMITDIFMILISLIIFALIKPMFLLFCLIAVIFSIFVAIINLNFKTKNLEHAIKNSNFNNNISRELIDLISKEENSEMLKFNIEKIKNNFQQFEKIYSKKTSFDNNLSSFETFFTNLIYLLMVAAGAIYLINNQLNIGLLTFFVSLLGMFTNSTNNICNFPYKVKEYKKMSDVYWSFSNLSNIIKDSFIKTVNEINSITFCTEKDSSTIKRNSIIKEDIISLSNFNSINGFKNQNKLFFKNNFIKINPDTKISVEYIKENISRNTMLASDLLRFFNISLNKKTYSLREQQILNFIFVCFQNEKIICFNNGFKYLTKRENMYVKKKIKELISQNNFIFFINN